MKFFKLEYNSLNIKETGTQFQCVSVEKIGDMQKNIFPLEGLINFSFELPIPIMESKAKQTTLLNAIPINSKFIILKSYFIEFLKKFDIGEFQTWSLKIKQKSIYYDDYKLFVLNFPIQKEIIDFENTFFFKGKISDFAFTGNNLHISDYDKYLKIHAEFQNSDDDLLKIRKVCFDMRQVKVDMFSIYNFPFGGYYVSEKLKNAIEEHRFSGMVFTDIEKISDKLTIIY
jgi:hypothetical protein